MEKVYTFGEGNSLVGIVTETAGCKQSANRPAVIILNSGLIHHVGPHRLTVEMAREIAGLGFTVLRFDLSAIGDSPPRKSNPSYQIRAIGEIKEAMDFLGKQKKAEKFIVIGLCTGADNAHRITVTDQRVVGCVFLGGYAYPTVRTRVLKLVAKAKKIKGKLLVAGKWVAFINKFIRKMMPGKRGVSKHDADDSYFWQLPDKDATQKEYSDLISRNVSILFLFTASELSMINYTGQVRDSFRSLDFGDLLEVELYRYSDHTYTFLSQRKLMIDRVKLWMDKSYG